MTIDELISYTGKANGGASHLFSTSDLLQVVCEIEDLRALRGELQDKVTRLGVELEKSQYVVDALRAGYSAEVFSTSPTPSDQTIRVTVEFTQ